MSSDIDVYKRQSMSHLFRFLLHSMQENGFFVLSAQNLHAEKSTGQAVFLPVCLFFVKRLVDSLGDSEAQPPHSLVDILGSDKHRAELRLQKMCIRDRLQAG